MFHSITGSLESLRFNLPVTPVHDIVSEQNDLVIATHGRGFYVLDNIGMLRQMNSEVTQWAVYLFAPSNAIRSVSRGVTFDYFLKDAPQDFKMEILDSTGHIVQTLTSGAAARTERSADSGGDDEEGGLHHRNPKLRRKKE